ncbi:MAG: hypothetical protein JST89_24085 [Cyanobacteria bacterium SZAS-4]|nr:hypothetical protein [Cyanobacteria bacterium SZAS-4]
MSDYKIIVHEPCLYDYMKSVMDSVMNCLHTMQIVTINSDRATRFKKTGATARSAKLGFTLYSDGFCSDFRIKYCLKPPDWAILKSVQNCSPFGGLPSNCHGPLRIEIAFDEPEPILTCARIERIQAEPEFLRSYFETVLATVETGLLAQIQFKSAHSCAKISLELDQLGTLTVAPRLTTAGLLINRKSEKAVIEAVMNASPFGPVPGGCQKVRLYITATAAGIFSVGGLVMERRRKPDYTLWQQRRERFSRRKNDS